MTPVTVWTPERERILKRLVKDGALVCTQQQAAVLVGVKRFCIHTYCRKHGISAKWPNVWTPAHQSAFMEFVRDGILTETVNAIAKKLNVSTNVITGQARNQGIATQNNAAEMKRRVAKGVLELSANGEMKVSTGVAAVRIGCSLYAVEDMMKQFDIRPLPPAEDQGRKGKVRRKDKTDSGFWTARRKALLDSMTDNEGRLTVTVKKAAEQIGCSRWVLRQQLLITGLAKPKRAVYDWTIERQLALKALCARGVLTTTVAAAAKRMGCTSGQLREGLKSIDARMKPRCRWTDTRLDQLRTIMDGRGRLTVTRREACRLLDCDIKALRFGIVLLKAPAYAVYDWTPQRIEKLRSFADGDVLRYPLPDVMARLGCSEKVLRLAMKKLGLTAKPQFQWTADAERKFASLMRPDGKLSVTHDRAAELLGCSPRSIDNRMAWERKRLRGQSSPASRA